MIDQQNQSQQPPLKLPEQNQPTEDQRFIVVPNNATNANKKSNKKEKWAMLEDSQKAVGSLFSMLSNAPVFTIEAREEVLDMISITSLDRSITIGFNISL